MRKLSPWGQDGGGGRERGQMAPRRNRGLSIAAKRVYRGDCRRLILIGRGRGEGGGGTFRMLQSLMGESDYLNKNNPSTPRL